MELIGYFSIFFQRALAKCAGWDLQSRPKCFSGFNIHFQERIFNDSQTRNRIISGWNPGN